LLAEYPLAVVIIAAISFVVILALTAGDSGDEDG